MAERVTVSASPSPRGAVGRADSPQASGVGGVDAPRRSDPRTPRARRLRREATPAERRLWAKLKLIELPSGHFRRQVPVGQYFADFAHHGLRLVVELDGGQHGFDNGVRHDAARTDSPTAAGYRVLRFWNHEVRDNLDGVVETILAALAAYEPPTPVALRATRPSPPRAGGGGTDGARSC